MDDILIYANTKEEYDKRLKGVLKISKKHKVTLNLDNCEFSMNTVRFLWQIINGFGIKANPRKVQAVMAMSRPQNVTELRTFLGMANHLNKFTHHLSENTKLLHELLSTKRHWCWDQCSSERII